MSHVAVLGGGLGGTLAAAAVAPHADRVTIIERDALPDRPAPRPGLPQARHPHTLWSGGVEAIESLLPGMTEQLIAHGAHRIKVPGDAVWWAGTRWVPRAPGRHYVLSCSRNLLDWVLREQCLTHVGRGLCLRTGTQALGLVGSRERVTGVRVRDQQTGATEVLDAALVIDATGRASRADHWLAELGLPPIPQTTVDWQAGYATRLFRAPGNSPIVWIQPDFLVGGPARGAMAVPIEDGQWLVTLMGTHGGAPTAEHTQATAFADFARSARHPLVAELIDDAEPVGPIHLVRTMRWRRRRCTGPARTWPDGFAVLGDAAATFNPVLVQGMSAAALSAAALGEALRDGGPAGCGPRIQRAVDRVTRRTWLTGQVLNLLYLDANPSLAVRIIRRLGVRAFDAAGDWPTLRQAAFDVLSSSAPITAMLTPRALLAVLRGPLSRPLPGPPLYGQLPCPADEGTGVR
ncbi:FAD-dependent monooxygenase [Streptomyces monashensis]|uniref:NAD(P)/FAD-dependent oxidoreductase n=1 Tax=Streptomyces monashensis TaxID=1678012 RepID=UPI0033E6C45A